MAAGVESDVTQAALFQASEITVDEGGLDSLATPPEILALVDQFWPQGYHLDPTTNAGALTRPTVAAWTLADDCFTKPTWAVAGAHTRIWLNPPYSGPGRFLRWLALAHWDELCECLALVRHDHSTQWWAEACESATRWAALRWRPRFWLNGKRTGTGGTFAADLFYWGPRAGRFDEVFREIGWTFHAMRQQPTWRRE